MFDLTSLLRENIKNITPYSSARDEYTGSEGVFLDANENPYGSVGVAGYNRYPDPLQTEVKEKLSKIKDVPVDQIFLGNGSDEAIDLLFRAFCEPKKDNVVILPPTYGMYQVCADVNDVEVRKVSLTKDYLINEDGIYEVLDGNTKIIWVCSPNNPTGNLVQKKAIINLLTNFPGIVVVDEAYIDFADQESFTSFLDLYPNLVVMQTFSKAWGLAALRLGMAYASKELISVLNKIKYPYNVNLATQELALKALNQVEEKNRYVKEILDERKSLSYELLKFSDVEEIYPSDANFLLVKIKNAKEVFDQLIEKLIIVRDRSKVTLCEGTLRITIGTAEENKILVDELKAIIH